MSNVKGNSKANVLKGTNSNDVIDGGAGADTMSGKRGDDLYIVDNVGDVVVELANEGNDTVEASVNYTLSANVENLILTGAGDLSGTGNDLANLIVGDEGDNLLSGGAGDDIIYGDPASA